MNNSTSPAFSSGLSKIWWLWAPLLMLAAQAVIEVSFDPQTLAIMHSENGPHETVQFALLAAAFIVALRTLAGFPFRARPWLGAWIALAAACCLYVGGEEISWGQHILGWTTPEFWQAVNDQQETNLHNTSSWLDQKPRALLEAGVIAGGVLIPLLARVRPGWLPRRFAAIYPPAYAGVTAVLFLFCKLADKTGEALGLRMFERVSEVNELFVYYFVLLYILHIYKTVKFTRQ